MPKEFSRNLRVADQIQRSLAQLIQTNIADPRVGLVNINSVDVDRDYANARVYVSFISAVDDDKAENEQAFAQQAVEVLNGAAGYLRSLLARTLNSRTTPRLIFVLDGTTLRGQKLSNLIDRAVASDRNHR